MDSIKTALEIAKRDLRKCYSHNGILAGLHHFSDYWAHDSFFASFGCLVMKDYDIVKKNLNMHLKQITKSGQLPVRIGKTTLGIILAYLGFKPRSNHNIYAADKTKYPAMDQNSLFVISLYKYYKTTEDKKIVRDNIQKIEKILLWNFQNDSDKDLLIEEHEYCNWADSLKKKGKVLYTNVCHCYALHCISKIFEDINHAKSNHYNDLYNKVKHRINELFWNGEYYIDWIDDGKIFNYFSTDGNFLAVLWDIADREKAKNIEDSFSIYEQNELPCTCVHPKYPGSLISGEIRLIIPDYHNGLSWLWLGAVDALAKHKLGLKAEAEETLLKMASAIIKYNGVFEVYDKNGKPVKRLTYVSEYPLAWSAGLFIYAAEKII